MVLREKAALWTDGRYFLQADEQLQCNYWILMRTGKNRVFFASFIQLINEFTEYEGKWGSVAIFVR